MNAPLSDGSLWQLTIGLVIFYVSLWLIQPKRKVNIAVRLLFAAIALFGTFVIYTALPTDGLRWPVVASIVAMGIGLILWGVNKLVGTIVFLIGLFAFINTGAWHHEIPYLDMSPGDIWHGAWNQVKELLGNASGGYDKVRK